MNCFMADETAARDALLLLVTGQDRGCKIPEESRRSWETRIYRRWNNDAINCMGNLITNPWKCDERLFEEVRDAGDRPYSTFLAAHN